MIPQTPILPHWKRELAEAVRDGSELLRAVGLAGRMSSGQLQAARQFPVLVPKSLLARIVPGDPEDPVLRQVLPLDAEMHNRVGYHKNPLREDAFSPLPGVLHKYHGRALMIVTGGCAVNCRYCFRRHFPYAEHRLDSARLAQGLQYISADPSIFEIILSGGDPLLLDDARLGRLIKSLGDIPHLQLLRIHSRIPVVLPSRVTLDLCQTLERTRLGITLVLHSNCAPELDDSVHGALRRLQQSQVVLLNQSVLLRGVNDSLKTLRELSLGLYRCGVLPYYLFLLDPVQGAAHFDIPEAQALQLHNELRAHLPGYLVPRLAREVPGDTAKRLLSG